MLTISMDININYITSDTSRILIDFVAYSISPSTFLLGYLVRLFHPNVDVTILGIVTAILLSVTIAKIRTEDPFF